MKLRIIVTGSRDWTDRIALFNALWAAVGVDESSEVSVRPSKFSGRVEVTVVHGAARGADACAHQWCGVATNASSWLTVTEEAHPADWDKHGKAAGPIRNSEMAALGGDLCLAFPKEGPGTWDMVRKANKAGIVVHVHPERKR